MRLGRRDVLRLSAGVTAAVYLAPRPRSVAASEEPGWRQPRFDTDNTANPDGPVPDNVTEYWSADAGVVGNPILDDETVYVAGSGTVTALPLGGGEPFWEFDAGGSISTPCTDGEQLYFTSGRTTYALDSFTGIVEWTHDGRGGAAGAPVVDGNLYVPKDNSVYCLGTSTGAQIWRYETGGPVRATPAVHDGTVYVGSEDGDLHAVDADDGGTEWFSGVASSVNVAPVVDGNIFAVGARGAVRSFDTSGSENWDEALNLNSPVEEPPALDDDYLYVPTDDGTVHAVRRSTPWEDWSFEGDGSSATAPTVADGVVYVGIGGTLHALDANNGDELWSYETSDAGAPTVADDRLYIGDSRLRVLGEEGEAELAVTSASVSPDTVDVGEEAEVVATVENTGARDGSATTVLYIDGDHADEAEVEVAAGETGEQTFTVSFDETGEYGIAVNDADAGTVTVTGDADDGEETGAEDDADGDGTDESEGLAGFGVAVASVAAAVTAYLRTRTEEQS